MELINPNIDILIVDDRLDGLIALEAVLALPKVNLVKARSGKEALSLLQKYDFGVILLDVQMPEMDGFETARRIRDFDQYKTTPIIFVTAINKDDQNIYRGYEVGAVDYIFKPFEPQILRSKISIFVDLYRKTRQLREQNEIIRESERKTRYLQLAQLEMETLKRYRNLADAIPSMVWKSKVDGTLDYFNKVWTDYTGLSSEKSVGVGWQEAIDHKDLRNFLKAWMGSMISGQSFETECRIRRFDGENRWHWVHAVPERDNAEKVIGWIGTAIDIHDRKLAERDLIEAKKIAESANLAKTQFLANMSHEIRTPLGAMLGFAELLLNPDLNYEERVQHVNAIRRSGDQLLIIIDEILDISKVEAGHLEVESIDMDLGKMLRDLKTLLSIKAQAKGVGLDFVLKTPVPEHLISDPTRLRQILLNMLCNGIKFTEKGKVRMEVEWKGSPRGDASSLRFQISDTGVGISVEQRKKLFQPFVQVDSSTTRKFGGTGLGLALSRKLAMALGGNVWLEKSEIGVGSIFVVEICAKAVGQTTFISELNESQTEKTVFDKQEDAHALDGVKILLVEDAPINQILISKFLTGSGAEVELAKNGVEGMKKALAGDFGVVLMDIQMPEMDGYEATQELRAKGYNRPIIALTAHALKEDRDRCLKVGCTDHLTKPIDRKKLISQVLYHANH